MAETVLQTLPSQVAGIRRLLVRDPAGDVVEVVELSAARIQRLPQGGVFAPFKVEGERVVLGPPLASRLDATDGPALAVLGLVERVLEDLATLHANGAAHGGIAASGFGVDAEGWFRVRACLHLPPRDANPLEADVAAVGLAVRELLVGRSVDARWMGRLDVWLRGAGVDQPRIGFADGRAALQAWRAVIGREKVSEAVTELLERVGGRLPRRAEGFHVRPALRGTAPAAVRERDKAAFQAREWVAAEMERVRAERYDREQKRIDRWEVAERARVAAEPSPALSVSAASATWDAEARVRRETADRDRGASEARARQEVHAAQVSEQDERARRRGKDPVAATASAPRVEPAEIRAPDPSAVPDEGVDGDAAAEALELDGEGTDEVAAPGPAEEARVRMIEEARAAAEAARVDAERRAAEERRVEAERAEVERRAREEAEARRVEAERAETDRRSREEARRVEAERVEAERRAREEAERAAREEAAEWARREAEEQARRAEDEARRVEAERVRKAVAEQARREAEEQARREAEAIARRAAAAAEATALAAAEAPALAAADAPALAAATLVPEDPEGPPEEDTDPGEFDPPTTPGPEAGPRWSGAVGVTGDPSRMREKGPGKWVESGRSAEELASQLPSGGARPLDLEPVAPARPRSMLPWVVVVVLALALAAVVVLR